MRSENRRPAAGRPGPRQLRVGEVVRHALSQVLHRGEAKDPGLDGVSVTVTEVRVSSDLRRATAFVMPLGGADAAELVASLRRAAPFLRRRIGKAVALKRLPELSFALDSRFDNADRINALLQAVASDVRPSAPQEDDA